VILFIKGLQQAMIISPMMSIGPKQEESEAPLYYGSMFGQQLSAAALSSVVLFIGTMFCGLFYPHWKVGSFVLPLALTAFAHQLQEFIRRYFFTRGKPFVAFVNDFICHGGKIAAIVWLFVIGALDTATALWAIAATSVLSFLVGLKSLDEVRRPSRAQFASVARRHWGFSKWLTASALMQWMSTNFFTITAAAFLGASAAGAMRAAQNIMGALHILFFGLDNVTPISASRILHEQGVRPMVAYLKKVIVLGGAVTVSFAALAAYAPEFWLTTVYGDDYRGFGFVLQWYALIYVVIFFSAPLLAGLRALEETRPHFWACAASTLFTIAGFAPLISGFGLAGALAGVFGANLIQQVIIFIALKKRVATSADSALGLDAPR